MISIRNFESYREYLKQVLNEGKSSDPPLTLTRLAKSIDTSPSSLQMIISGKRNLTVHKIHQIIETLGLTEAEAEYFEALVLFEQAESPREKSFYLNRLKRWKLDSVTQSEINISRVSAKELISEWYIPALLIYFIDTPGEPDFKRIEDSLGITQKQVLQALKVLTDAGILEFRGKNINIVYDKMASSFRKEEYLKRLLTEISRRMHRDFRNGQSYYEAHTLTMCSERYLDFVSDYKKLISEYIEKGPKSDKPIVYQAFIAMMGLL